MKSEQLYKLLAKYYDDIYAEKDYKGEAEALIKLISDAGIKERSKLLDLACGTGNHLKYLKEKYICNGLDKNIEMLKIAEKKLPGIGLMHQDMLKRIEGRYDVIISMFSSIAYVQSYSAFRTVACNISDALKPGGMLIIQPWFESGAFEPGVYQRNIEIRSDLSILRLMKSSVEGICSILEYHYLINENGKIHYIKDEHSMALFSNEKLIEILSWNKIETQFIPPKEAKGRGLLIGRKVE